MVLSAVPNTIMSMPLSTKYRPISTPTVRAVIAGCMKERTPEREESVPDGAEEADLRNIQDYGAMTKGMLSEKEEW